MITAKPGTRFYDALRYIEPAIGRMPYGWWTSGAVPDGAPAYAINAPAPPIRELFGRTIFCAGVPNLMLRRVGKRIPTRGNASFDGGVGAYFWSSLYGPGYFTGYDEPFDLEKAKRWARESRSGVLIGRFYRGSRDQGHVAVLLPSGYVLQSYDGGNGRPGLNWQHTVEASHAGWYYETMCHSSQWIDYAGDEVRS